MAEIPRSLNSRRRSGDVSLRVSIQGQFSVTGRGFGDTPFELDIRYAVQHLRSVHRGRGSRQTNSASVAGLSEISVDNNKRIFFGRRSFPAATVLPGQQRGMQADEKGDQN